MIRTKPVPAYREVKTEAEHDANLTHYRVDDCGAQGFDVVDLNTGELAYGNMLRGRHPLLTRAQAEELRDRLAWIDRSDMFSRGYTHQLLQQIDFEAV